MAIITDGTFTTAKQDGPRRPEYPFGNAPIPDVYPVAYNRTMVVLPGSHTANQATRTTYTNLIKESETFNSATWAKTNLTVSANGLANPQNGLVTADVLEETVTNAEHQVDQGYTFAAIPYTFSVYARAGLRSYIRLQMFDGANYHECFFNISAGTVMGASVGVVGAIAASSGSFYRCSMTVTPAAGAGYVYINLSTNGTTVSYAGTVASGAYVYGAQLEAASVAGAYSPTTSTSASISVPNIESLETQDGSDAFAYLVAESPPEMFGPGAFSFTRTHARIPKDQVIPGSRFFNRPVMHGIKSGTAYAVSFDELQQFSWVFTSARKAVTRVVSIPSVSIPATMPSSNITFVEGGRTLNIAANSTAAQFVTGFNTTLTGLTNVWAQVQTGVVNIIWTGTMTSVTAPTGVTTTLFSGYSVTLNASGLSSTLATTALEATAHGGVAGDRVALWNGDALVGRTTVVSVPDANNFNVLTDGIDAANMLITHCAFSSDAAACYVNGPKQCTVKSTQKFYLPGVTSGITTYADIPDQTVYTDPVSWLGRILAVPTGYACIAVSDLTQWMGPILMQEVTEIQMSDAIDTVTP